MYEIITLTLGPFCVSYNAKIYTNKEQLITQACGNTKENARRNALKKLEKLRSSPIPVSFSPNSNSWSNFLYNY